jgi:N-acetylmuramoyl-L-alanine amidase
MTMRIQNSRIKAATPSFSFSSDGVLPEKSFISGAEMKADEKDPSETVIVIDLARKVAGRIDFSEDEKGFKILFTENSPEGESNAFTEAAEKNGLPAVDWRAAGDLICIDPGHGGSDPGAIGKINGKKYYEKDLNFAIALKIRDYLSAAGVRVALSRETYTFSAHNSRPSFANTVHADLTVSIHNNSSTSPSVNGTEVLYYVMEKEEPYPVDSEILASNIYKEMKASLKIKARGLIKDPDYALIKRCLMPSCIVEGAYISNASDLEYMITEEFQTKYAYAVARGIIETINAGVK